MHSLFSLGEKNTGTQWSLELKAIKSRSRFEPSPLYFAGIWLNATLSAFTLGDMFVVVGSGGEVPALQAQWSPLWALLLTALVHLLHLQDSLKHNPAGPQGHTGWVRNTCEMRLFVCFVFLLLSLSHLCSDAHWPWHTGISVTLLQLPIVTFTLVNFGAQRRLPANTQRRDRWE